MSTNTITFFEMALWIDTMHTSRHWRDFAPFQKPTGPCAMCVLAANSIILHLHRWDSVCIAAIIEHAHQCTSTHALIHSHTLQTDNNNKNCCLERCVRHLNLYGLKRRICEMLSTCRHCQRHILLNKLAMRFSELIFAWFKLVYAPASMYLYVYVSILSLCG